MVCVHARALIANVQTTAVVQGDLRDPASVLHHSETRRIIDFSKPIALLLVAILHFIDDDDEPYAAVRRFTDALAPGSLLILTHGSQKSGSPETGRRVRQAYRGSTVVNRPPEEIVRFFEGFELVLPGLVPVTRWRAGAASRGDGLESVEVLGAVARKR